MTEPCTSSFARGLYGCGEPPRLLFAAAFLCALAEWNECLFSGANRARHWVAWLSDCVLIVQFIQTSISCRSLERLQDLAQLIVGLYYVAAESSPKVHGSVVWLILRCSKAPSPTLLPPPLPSAMMLPALHSISVMVFTAAGASVWLYNFIGFALLYQAFAVIFSFEYAPCVFSD